MRRNVQVGPTACLVSLHESMLAEPVFHRVKLVRLEQRVPRIGAPSALELRVVDDPIVDPILLTLREIIVGRAGVGEFGRTPVTWWREVVGEE